MIRRRDLLSAALAAAGLALVPRRARAIGDHSKFRFAQLKVSGNWNPRPTGLPRLAWEIDKRTSIDVTLEPTPIAPSDEALFSSPFLYLSGDGGFSPLTARETKALRRFLQFGGFLCIDSAEGRAGGEFDASVRRLVDDLFPGDQGLAPLPEDHVIWKSFYLLSSPAGRVSVTNELEAVIHDGRAAVVYDQNDLSGAWARDDYGKWEHECYPGGDDQREMAFRLGINLAMYSLCLDYKADQVHIPFILKRRKWRSE